MSGGWLYEITDADRAKVDAVGEDLLGKTMPSPANSLVPAKPKRGYSLSEICAVLGRVHCIGFEHYQAFSARLRNLLRIGAAGGQLPGKGRQSGYSWAQFYRLALGLEFIQLGVQPETIKAILDNDWPLFVEAIDRAMVGERSHILVCPMALGNLMTEGDGLPVVMASDFDNGFPHGLNSFLTIDINWIAGILSPAETPF